MRSFFFSLAYWVLSGFYVLVAALASIVAGAGVVQAIVRFYCRRMLWAMHWIAGIKVDLMGRERLPDGAFIIAAKHHSWGDGYVMFGNVDRVAFVTGDPSSHTTLPEIAAPRSIATSSIESLAADTCTIGTPGNGF